MELDDPPYKVEYAKSGRAACKACKDPIAQASLRFAIMVQSRHFDGKTPNWFHSPCFWKRSRPVAVEEIGGFDKIRWEDQEKTKELIRTVGQGITAKPGKKASSGQGMYTEFDVELAKSGGAKCRVCEEKIKANNIRMARRVREDARSKMYGPYMGWHHVDCFYDKRDELGFDKDKVLEWLPGFAALKETDRSMLISKFGAGNKRAAVAAFKNGSSDGPAVKKSKKEAKVEDELMKRQSNLLWEIKDKLRADVNKKARPLLLEYNSTPLPQGEDDTLDRLADIMAFGPTEKCPECKHTTLVYSSTANAYRCVGNMTEWTKCTYITQIPKRRAFKIPKEFKDVDYLNEFEFIKRDRIFAQRDVIKSSVEATTSGAKTNGSAKSTPTLQAFNASKPLSGFSFFVMPKLPLTKTKITKITEKLGGKIISTVTPRTTAVFGKEAHLEGKEEPIKDAKRFGVHVISCDFFEALATVCKEGLTKLEEVCEVVRGKSIAKWGGEVLKRIAFEGNVSAKSGAVNPASGLTLLKGSSKSKSLAMKMKGGSVVDPDSGMEDQAHVLKINGVPLTCVLSMVDISRGTNSYYRLQVLQHDSRDVFYVFRAWGRVGTEIGGNKIETFYSQAAALNIFKELFLEKTGNIWGSHLPGGGFVKNPSRFYPLELDFGRSDAVPETVEIGKGSKLALEVQSLVQLIFDLKRMKETMVSFEIDLEKLPLGRLSQSHIDKAYNILTEANNLVEKSATEGKILDASNRFFTLIPHNFGMNKPPLLDNLDLIRKKTEMLDSLRDIEAGFRLISVETGDDKTTPVDSYYAKLRTDIQLLARASEEFQLIEKYVQNTHAKTHSMYTLELEDVFKVEREGESLKYNKYRDLQNRMLLWHGSSISNYAGILSQGLRIAPPEAPVTGYMFGKGVYFADMVSKSANYCRSSSESPAGLLLLCEVALGEMYELKEANNVTKLPSGKSSVKGLGRTQPDPRAQVRTEDGAIVPCGSGCASKVKGTSLLYNEYIVYDTAQINMKYLLKVKFNFKY